MSDPRLSILISTGEVSGDLAGAEAAKRLRCLAPDATLIGLGGARMEAAGVRLLARSDHLGAVGLSEALAVGPGYFRIVRSLRRVIASNPPPRAALLIGNDVFNTALGRWLRRRGIPAVAWFPPQVWLWRRFLGVFARSFDEVLASFPDEERGYREAGAPTVAVGHYLCDHLRPVSAAERWTARRALGLADGRRIVGLLPGSRDHEIRRLAPILFGAAARLRRRDPRLLFFVPLARPRDNPRLRRLVLRHAPEAEIVLVPPGPQSLAAAELLLVASGTATLEAALLGVPMVVVYRVSWTTRAALLAARGLGWIRSETVALPNLLGGDGTVPELRQTRASHDRLAAAARRLLDDPAESRAQRARLKALRSRVARPGTADRVARRVLRAARVVRSGHAEPDAQGDCPAPRR